MDFETTAAVGQHNEAGLPLLVDNGHVEADACKRVSAHTTTRIIKRIKALVLRLLPMQVALDDLTDPTSNIITTEVVQAFEKAAGDYSDVLPFALLEARRAFFRDALANPADYDENQGRKLACEAIARKLVNRTTILRQHVVLSTRYTRIESDGDVSSPTSALESAVDQNATFFLSSGECQRVTTALWRGHLIQVFDEDGHTTYGLYKNAGKGGFLDHFDPSRLAVPRTQNYFRVVLWLVFLVAYTWALQTPDRAFGVEDVILYVQFLGYLLEDITKLVKVGKLEALSFWTYINFGIYALLIAAFGYRIADTATPEENFEYRRRSFMILSCAAPLVWAKLLSIFDLLTFFGVLQIVVWRMLRESAVFFALLAFISIGFAQALTGLDVADKAREATVPVIRTLFEALLGSPNFDLYSADDGAVEYPYGIILYYSYSLITIVILLNVLIALFGSAYAQVTDDAVPHFMSFFSRKVVAAIRAPDQYVYVAPFNLVEICILPLEFILSRDTYAKINRVLMTALFWPAMACIALYESRWDARKVRAEVHILEEPEEELEENPDAEDESEGKICTADFDSLIKHFPDLTASVESTTLREVRELKRLVASMRTELDDLHGGKVEDAKPVKKED